MAVTISGAAGRQISTWLPSSTTRLVGSLKNSIALSALRSIQANSFSRQIAMPGRGRGDQGLAGEEEAGVHHLELRAAALDLGQRGGDVGLLHEAVAEDQPVEALAELVELEALLLLDIGHVLDLDGQQHHPLVQHLVVLEVVQQRVGHAVGGGGHEHRGAGHPGRARWPPT